MNFKGDQSKVLIAPVGDPSGWVKAKYKCKNDEESTTKSGYFSLVCENEHSEIILIVQDSIVFPTSISKYRNELYNNCKEHTPCYSGARIDTYEQLVEMAERYANCVFSEYKDKLKVIVVPSIGFFKDNCSDEKTVKMHSNAHPDIIRSLLTIKIYEELSRSNSPSLTVDVDLTHGVNYLNQLVSQAVRDVASVLSLSRQQVKLNFYSAVPSVERNEYMYLKVISSETPVLAIYKDKPNYPALKAIKIALESNAPLLLLFYLQKYDLSEIEQDKEKLSKIAKLTCNSSTCTIQYDLNATPRLFKKFYNSYYYIIFRELLAYRENPKEGMYFSIRQVNKLSKKVFRFNNVSKHIINAEISNIVNIVKDKNDFEADLSEIYKEIYKQEESHEEEQGSRDEYRNFVAHAGLKKDVTKIKKKEDEVLLTYNQKMNGFIMKYKWPPINL